MRSTKTATAKNAVINGFKPRNQPAGTARSGALRASVRTPPGDCRDVGSHSLSAGTDSGAAQTPRAGPTSRCLRGSSPGPRTRSRGFPDVRAAPRGRDRPSSLSGSRILRGFRTAGVSGAGGRGRERVFESSGSDGRDERFRTSRAPRSLPPTPRVPRASPRISRARRHLPRRALPRGDRPVDRPRRARRPARGRAGPSRRCASRPPRPLRPLRRVARRRSPSPSRRVSRGAPDVTLEMFRVGVGERPAGVPVRGSAWTRDDRDHHHARDGTVDASRPRCRFDPFARAVDIAETAAVLACVAAADDGSGSDSAASSARARIRRRRSPRRRDRRVYVRRVTGSILVPAGRRAVLRRRVRARRGDHHRPRRRA